jgi:4-amino-4-deoxy-L-arabinose transferase-like glycosyltransferase
MSLRSRRAGESSHRPACHPDDRAARAIIALTLAGLFLRVAWLVIARPEPVSDFLGYRSLADRLLTTHQFTRNGVATAYRTPGYPVTLALGMIVSRANWWLSSVNIALSTAAIPATWVLATRLGVGRRTAIVSAALVAFVPTFVLYSPVLASEHLQLILVLWAWCLSLRVRTGGQAVVCGLVYGVAVLVRPESLFFLLALPWMIRFAVPTWRRAAWLATVTALGSALVVLPWCVRNEIVVGRGAALSTTGGFNLYLAHRTEPGYRFLEPEHTELVGLDELATSRRGQELALQNIRSDPVGLVSTTWHHTYELYRTPTYASGYSTLRNGRENYVRTVSHAVETSASRAVQVGWYAIVALLPVGIAGLLLIRRLRRARDALVALVVANWLCFAVIFWGMPRYRYAIEPLLCIVAALGISAIVDVLHDRRVGPAR